MIKESPFGTISSVRTTSSFNYKKCGSPFYRNVIIEDEVESTTVKSTVSSAPIGFISESFPLNVDYQRRQFSSKKILGTQFPHHFSPLASTTRSRGMQQFLAMMNSRTQI